jgi:hypothetical protein
MAAVGCGAPDDAREVNTPPEDVATMQDGDEEVAVARQPYHVNFGSWSVAPGTATDPDNNFSVIHAALLETGQVLYFSGSEYLDSQHASPNRTRLYYPPFTSNPISVTSSPSPSTWDLFCAGHTFNSTGDLVVVGGTEYFNGPRHTHFTGVRYTAKFNRSGGTWTSLPNMTEGRWYPTVVYGATNAHPNGKVYAIDGHPQDSFGGPLPLDGTTDHNNAPIDVHDGTGTAAWSQWGTFSGQAYDNYYPRAFVFGGAIHIANKNNADWWLTGSGPVQSVGVTALQTLEFNDSQIPADKKDVYAFQSTWTQVMGPISYSAFFGGWLFPLYAFNGYKAYRKHVGFGDVPWEAVAPRNARVVGEPLKIRKHGSATLMSTGDIFLSGGWDGDECDDSKGVTHVEIYRPSTDTWYVVSDAGIKRGYHSVALMLKDGRIWTAGSTRPGGCQVQENTQEIFTPWYYNDSGQPNITGWPSTLPLGPSTFTITLGANSWGNTTPGTAITKVAIIRPGSVTHSMNFDQRYIELEITGSSSTTVTVKGPPDKKTAPPGYWFLVALKATGNPDKPLLPNRDLRSIRLP